MTTAHLILVIATVASTTITASSKPDQKLTWETHYGNAKKVAQAAKRPLVVVIESNNAADKIDEGALQGEPEKKLVKDDFQLVRVDADTDYGKRVAKAFGVRSFPYTAVTDDVSEKIVFRKSGPMSKDDWMVALKKSAKTRVLARADVSTAAVEAAAPTKVYVQEPIVSPHEFAPNGFYQIPQSQCFT